MRDRGLGVLGISLWAVGYAALTLMGCSPSQAPESHYQHVAPPGPSLPNTEAQKTNPVASPSFNFTSHTLPQVDWPLVKLSEARLTPVTLARRAVYDSVTDTLFLLGESLDSRYINQKIGRARFKAIVINAFDLTLAQPILTHGASISITTNLIRFVTHDQPVFKDTLPVTDSYNPTHGQIITTPTILPEVDLRANSRQGQEGLPGGVILLNAQSMQVNITSLKAMQKEPVLLITNGSSGGPALLGQSGVNSGQIKPIGQVQVDNRAYNLIYKNRVVVYPAICDPQVLNSRESLTNFRDCHHPSPETFESGQATWPEVATSANEPGLPGPGGLPGEVYVTRQLAQLFNFEPLIETRVGKRGQQAPQVKGGQIVTLEGELSGPYLVAQEFERIYHTHSAMPRQSFVHPVTGVVIQPSECLIYQDTFSNQQSYFRCVMGRMYEPGFEYNPNVDQIAEGGNDLKQLRVIDYNSGAVSQHFLSLQKRVAQYLLWNSSLVAMGNHLGQLGQMVKVSEALPELQSFLMKNRNLIGRPQNEAPVFSFSFEYQYFKTHADQSLRLFSKLDRVIQNLKDKTLSFEALQSEVQALVTDQDKNQAEISTLTNQLNTLKQDLAQYQSNYQGFTRELAYVETQLKKQAEAQVEQRQSRQRQLQMIQGIGQLLVVSPIGQPMAQLIGVMTQSQAQLAKSQSLGDVFKVARESLKNLKRFEALDVASETQKNLESLKNTILGSAWDLFEGREQGVESAGKIIDTFKQQKLAWDQFLESQAAFQVPQEEYAAELLRLKSLSPEYIQLIQKLELLVLQRQGVIDSLNRTSIRMERLLSEWATKAALIQELERKRLAVSQDLEGDFLANLENLRTSYLESIVESLVHLKMSYDYITLQDNAFILEPINELLSGQSQDRLEVSLQMMMTKLRLDLVENLKNANPSYLIRDDSYHLTLKPDQIKALGEHGTLEFILGQEALLPVQYNARLKSARVKSVFSATADTKVGERAGLTLTHLGDGYLKLADGKWKSFEFPLARSKYRWGQSTQWVHGQMRQVTQTPNWSVMSIGEILGLDRDLIERLGVYSKPPLVGRYALTLNSQDSGLRLESVVLEFDFTYTE